MLNSAALTKAVQPLQSYGDFGPRDFDKYVWRLPIPAFDPSDPLHLRLVALAEKGEEVAAAAELTKVSFQAQRRAVRNALAAAGVAADLDQAVTELLNG